MVMGRRAGVPPWQLAEALASRLAALEEVTSVEVAGPGFVNLRLTDHAWRNELATIAHAGERYGKSEYGAGKTVNERDPIGANARERSARREERTTVPAERSGGGW